MKKRMIKSGTYTSENKVAMIACPKSHPKKRAYSMYTAGQKKINKRRYYCLWLIQMMEWLLLKKNRITLLWILIVSSFQTSLKSSSSTILILPQTLTISLTIVSVSMSAVDLLPCNPWSCTDKHLTLSWSLQNHMLDTEVILWDQVLQETTLFPAVRANKYMCIDCLLEQMVD